MIKKIQKLVGTPADGIWGPKSERALKSSCSETKKAVQRLLGNLLVDGRWGKLSQDALDLQIWRETNAWEPAAKPAVMGIEFDSRTEKTLATLIPAAQGPARKFMRAAIAEMSKIGLTVRIIGGTRTYAQQDALYTQGRTKPGKVVTNARGGYSNHNFGVAWDIGLFKGAKYLEDSPAYTVLGSIGKAQGLDWGGSWRSLQDEPHYGLKTGLTLKQMRARIAAGETVA